MSKNKAKDIVYITEHVVEIRHEAAGEFLDKRGSIADSVKNENQEKLPHWKIEENAITFFDTPLGIKTIGAAISYKNIAFFVYNPPTCNFFQDNASSFLDKFKKNKVYTIPKITRLGIRTRCFIPSELSFDQINKLIRSKFLNEDLIKTLGGTQNDLQIILDFTVDDFEIKLVLGPIKTNEARKYFNFDEDRFRNAGLYIDLDFHKNQAIPSEQINKLLSLAMEKTWSKLDLIAQALQR